MVWAHVGSTQGSTRISVGEGVQSLLGNADKDIHYLGGHSQVSVRRRAQADNDKISVGVPTVSDCQISPDNVVCRFRQ